MGRLERLASQFAIKAEPAARSVVTNEPRFSPEGSSVYAVANARTHAKAYGGGKDGVDWFYDAANVIGKAASTAPLHFADKDGQRFELRPDKAAADAGEVKPVPDDLRELFEQPNPWMGWQEHMHLAIIDLLAVGNYFWLKHNADKDGNKPYALYRLNPGDVQIVSAKRKLIDHYVYGQGRDAMKIRPQDIIHGRLPNPHSPHSMLGLGMVQAAPQAFDIELGMVEAQRSFFQRGTVLAGTLESEKNVPEPNRKRTIKEFRNLNRGAGQWYNVAFLERGLRYRPIQANAQEAGYEALSKLSRDRIFALAGVPKILGGIDDGSMKLQEARQFFAEDTMQPLLGTEAPGSGIAHVLTVSLAAAWGLRVVYDYEYQLPETDRTDLALTFSELPGVTVGEVREKAGLARFGPDIVDDEGVAIDDYVLNMPGSSTESQDGTPSPGGSRGGRPPNRENVPRFQQDPNAADRDGENVNGRRASAADRSRRLTAGVVKPRKRAGKASGGVTPAELATGLVLDRIPAGVNEDG